MFVPLFADTEIKLLINYTSSRQIFLLMQIIESDNYSIYLGDDIFSSLQDFLKRPVYKQSKIYILVDENTLKNCLPELVANVDLLIGAEIIEIESGEESKNIEVCLQIWQVLMEMKADRKSLFINLGGGVISDMGGFVASTYKRGIDFINIPTTLLAQVDASIGGKTGVDVNHIKNQVGVFNNPKAVFIYPGFLRTVSKRQILSGYAEIVKHGLIADKNFWNVIKKTKLTGNDCWGKLIPCSLEIKTAIILQDPWEKDIRKTLNFGHTIGHAIESYFLEEGEEILLHGEAIAIGMICESFLSYKKAGLDHAELDDICRFILSKFKPLIINEITFNRIIELMSNDKKNINNSIRFTLISETGKAVIDKKCSMELIKESLKFYHLRVAMLN